MNKNSDLAIDAAISQIKSLLSRSELVKKHKVLETIANDRSKVKIKMDIYNFIDNPADISNLLHQVKAKVPRHYSLAVEFKIEF